MALERRRKPAKGFGWRVLPTRDLIGSVPGYPPVMDNTPSHVQSPPPPPASTHVQPPPATANPSYFNNKRVY